jgi:hypothetical protein
MFKRIDRSAVLSKLLDRVSDTISRQRGLPIIIGVVMIFVSLLIQSLNVFISSPALELLGIWTLHLGVLTALIGILVVTPLGG